MKIYKNIKNGTKIGLIIAMIFVIIGIGYSIYNLIDAKTVPDKMVSRGIMRCYGTVGRQ